MLGLARISHQLSSEEVRKIWGNVEKIDEGIL